MLSSMNGRCGSAIIFSDMRYHILSLYLSNSGPWSFSTIGKISGGYLVMVSEFCTVDSYYIGLVGCWLMERERDICRLKVGQVARNELMICKSLSALVTDLLLRHSHVNR